MASSTPQRISSLYTLPMKILPVLITGGSFVPISVSAVIDPTQMFPNGVIILSMLLLALVFFIWYSYRLKFVSVDNDHLYVSGWSKHVAIPLSDIDSVDYFLGVKFQSKLIVVRLKTSCAFGATIYFIPTVGATIRASLNSPSVVEDLRSLMEHASKPASAI